MDILKQNIAKFEQNLIENENKIFDSKNLNYQILFTNNHQNFIDCNQYLNNNNGNFNLHHRIKDFSTTDTLVDADSSFADSFNKIGNFCNNFQINQLHFMQKATNQLPMYNSELVHHHIHHGQNKFTNKTNFMHNDEPLKIVPHQQLLHNQQQKNFNINTNLKNQFLDQNYQFIEDDDEEEKIIISIEDLSITTIQTSNLTSDSGELLPPLKNVQDDQFQQDLRKLDQKILKVKQLLESIKTA